MRRQHQFGMRENPVSDGRHGSRPTGIHSDRKPEGHAGEEPPYSDAAVRSAATAEEQNGFVTRPDVAMLPGSQAPMLARSFEPLITSSDAAHLLGNIHVKTVQRYARHGRLPGYQIGGHWYFRASELDSWLRSRLNSSCHPCRL